MRVLLVSTYDLGRQPLGLASPFASLRHAGVDVDCVDASRQSLADTAFRDAQLIAFYLPMHTATRLAAPLIERARRANPDAQLAAYGLYAPLNADWLRTRGVAHVIGAEGESALVALARSLLAPPAGTWRASAGETEAPLATSRLDLLLPDRSALPPLSDYAALQMPDGSRRVAGSTDATRGCKHLCRHCPIVPVYAGRFTAVPLDIVLEDLRRQAADGAAHMTFGDPDFLNGPTHARRLVTALHDEHPSMTYDVTIKIEHLLKHADMLPLLRETGCLFITSAVESIDDEVLEKLRKGHTAADFREAVARCGDAGVTLSPTFVPFTPWTTPGGYVDLLEEIAALNLVEHVAPVQLGIRLLVTARSGLLELPDIRGVIDPFDGESLTWPWRHANPAVDALQRDVMQIAAAGGSQPRGTIFAMIAERACAGTGRTPPPVASPAPARVPMLTESWYCCAEPIAQW